MKRKMKVSKQIISFGIFVLLLFLVNCKKKEDKQIEFNPSMMTKLDLSNTDTIILEQYFKSRKKFSKKVAFKYKSKVDTAYTVFKEAKFDFTLKKNFVQGYDYKLIFNIDNKKHEYYFQEIDFDTIRNGTTIFTTTKSYILNNKKYDFADAVYYLN